MARQREVDGNVMLCPTVVLRFTVCCLGILLRFVVLFVVFVVIIVVIVVFAVLYSCNNCCIVIFVVFRCIRCIPYSFSLFTPFLLLVLPPRVFCEYACFLLLYVWRLLSMPVIIIFNFRSPAHSGHCNFRF